MVAETPKGTVLAWLAHNPGLFAPVEEGERMTLYERATGKALTFAWAELVAARQATDRIEGGTYVQLAFANGRSLALARPGFAFAPSTVNSGPISGVPHVVCWQDFFRVCPHAEHLAAEGGRDQEALEGILLCIAVLDGARAAGFNVSTEERRLERTLKQIEGRRQV